MSNTASSANIGVSPAKGAGNISVAGTSENDRNIGKCIEGSSANIGVSPVKGAGNTSVAATSANGMNTGNCIEDDDRFLAVESATNNEASNFPDSEEDKSSVVLSVTKCKEKEVSSVETKPQNFKDLYQTTGQSDITVQVKHRKFAANKAILAEHSTVFSAMLKADMAEKHSGVITITDSDPDCFELFLKFMYTGEEKVVSTSNVTELYWLADKYNVLDLKRLCSQLILKELSVHSICDVLQLADLHSDEELWKKATSFFVMNTDAVINSSKWSSFTEKLPTVTNALIGNLANGIRERDTEMIMLYAIIKKTRILALEIIERSKELGLPQNLSEDEGEDHAVTD